jgi:hypothetical protein
MSNTTLYMISYHEEDTPSGITQEWFTTFNKAMRRLRQLKLSDSQQVYVREVPKTKVGLVDWLNSYARIG